MVARIMEARTARRSEIRADNSSWLKPSTRVHRPMYGSAGLLGLHADQVLYSFGGRHLVAAQQKLPP
jgi:hypothetical protein